MSETRAAGKQVQATEGVLLSDTPTRCMARLDSGDRCAAPPMTGEVWCWFHHPDLAEERAAARRKGGRGRRRKRTRSASTLVLETVQDAAAILAQEVDALLTCCFPSVARSRAVGYCLGVFCKLLEVGELEARIERLEQHVAAQEVGR